MPSELRAFKLKEQINSTSLQIDILNARVESKVLSSPPLQFDRLHTDSRKTEPNEILLMLSTAGTMSLGPLLIDVLLRNSLSWILGLAEF